ncbi:type II toxin-antitoxin system RelE/ParE family toxin [Salegentibacter echinorum]
MQKVEEAILLLKKNPEHYQKRYNEVRIIFMEIFPFALYYTLESNTVFIHAVLHTKRELRTGIERI